MKIDDKKMGYTYKSKKLSIAMKVRTFDAFSVSIFLYNSEIWTLTATLEKQIDSFHRRMLRKAIDIRWPKKISTGELYRKTKAEPWSKVIKRRRLNWLGHLMRMPVDTPARRSIEEALRQAKRNGGRPHLHG